MDKVEWNFYGFESSKVRMVVKWESEGSFTLRSFWWDTHTMKVINLRVNDFSLSYFTTIFTLEDFDLIFIIVWGGVQCYKTLMVPCITYPKK